MTTTAEINTAARFEAVVAAAAKLLIAAGFEAVVAAAENTGAASSISCTQESVSQKGFHLRFF